MASLDKIDRQILALLRENARMSNLELAESVNLSPTPCARRVKQLEDSGVITGYSVTTDPRKLGYQLSVYIAISMDKHTAERFSNFEKKLREFPEVVSCSIVTGRSEDYLIKALVKDMAHYEEFLLHRLNRIEGIAQVHTSFELRQVFEKSII
ncbi:Lrp/AsnC family transcriptional regulator [Moraxella osloensis]|jgi:Lrp/AsnC family leucine-responsive transcriptional regulator|uniref:Lrp/AsnC family transcriptional regulator n=1 Tax=Faucicola osloensis TaxID=34062 RepID=A0AAW6T7P3_FAUOS|nr:MULTISPECIES: Lrp/AsnC family transcriptional regulator [Moraxella]TGP49525.1 Lrp/AsnC family transcriptional regulator [bacterium M00.F.Ca.ET.230.01.1.1]ATQ85029.2 AsnC family transcriptional regulator [Moraxella osloensis]MDI4479787.1 Lrp/AsnC family transcriptional regulator [Moraxella osloensis]MDI4508667.1 Lrp/AsnC family transcriptional regulator [Moraxella osloensis]WNP28557.1 Lrp/AsnC family transcriptional regulator [Moraxella sp. DOX410]